LGKNSNPKSPSRWIKVGGNVKGFDVGLEVSGNPRAFDQMVQCMVMGGRIATLGIPPGRSPVD
jgi:threonine 3-dehydrogenase